MSSGGDGAGARRRRCARDGRAFCRPAHPPQGRDEPRARWPDGDPLEEWAALADQQFWCFGKDIEHPRGNLLRRYGLSRQGPPPDTEYASIYRAELSATRRIVLRGFGVFYGDDSRGGIFLQRVGVPRITAATDLRQPPWMITDLPEMRAPGPGDLDDVRWLMLDLIDWVRDYEVWVARQCGVAYRHAVVDGWRRMERPVIEADRIARSWRLMSLAISLDPLRICGDVRGPGDADGFRDRRRVRPAGDPGPGPTDPSCDVPVAEPPVAEGPVAEGPFRMPPFQDRKDAL